MKKQQWLALLISALIVPTAAAFEVRTGLYETNSNTSTQIQVRGTVHPPNSPGIGPTLQVCISGDSAVWLAREIAANTVFGAMLRPQRSPDTDTASPQALLYVLPTPVTVTDNGQSRLLTEHTVRIAPSSFPNDSPHSFYIQSLYTLQSSDGSLEEKTVNNSDYRYLGPDCNGLK